MESGFQTVLGFFTWWIEGLALALIRTETLFFRPRRFRLNIQPASLTIHPLDHGEVGPPLSLNPSELDKVPPDLIQKTRGGRIEIVVPNAAILERRLDPLPAESLPYVENVVQHQIDSLFPWHSPEILYSTKIGHKADGTLDVAVQATPRTAIETGLRAARALQADEIVIVGESQQSDQSNRMAFIACVGPESEQKVSRARRVARYAAAAVFTLTICVISWSTFARWSIESELAALDHAIVERRDILRRSLEVGAAAKNYGLETKKRLTPATVVVLDELSSILPDGTYLTDLSFEAGRLRISGVSTNAAELVPIIEGSGRFKNAAFYAPTTRQNDGSGDRFSIETTVLQPRADP